jgi:riboflavin kinase/FMN adenylyltransferase
MEHNLKEHTSSSAYQNTQGSAVTIGTFDGVHLGHRALLTRLVAIAKKERLESVLLTFFPHPRRVLQKDSDLKLINTISEKKQLLEAIGIDHMVVQPFTKEFSRLSSLEYVRDILVHQLNAKKIIIGYDHRFGRNRTANINDLKEFGATYNFEVEEISAQELDEVAVSSTKIRKALEAGDITTANNYLGYRFMLHGTVVPGKGLGKTFGYPTANLNVDEPYKMIPKKGVYLVASQMGGKQVYGLTSIGNNETIGHTKTTIETYFMNVDSNLYGQSLRLEFITHIRDQEIFETNDKLIEAIQKDEAFARAFLKRHE